MIDAILLAPYYLALKIRHFRYDHGSKAVYTTQVPSICVGNITVGGTGKTPHTEMLIRLLQSLPEWEGRQLAVLSRGYKRKSKGFQIVKTGGTAEQFGDEPLQVKHKFPEVEVVVDKDRVDACRTICGITPLNDKAKKKIAALEAKAEKAAQKAAKAQAKAEASGKSKAKEKAAEAARKASEAAEAAQTILDITDMGLRRARLVILDDAYQYRPLKATASIVLVDYNRPTFKDNLIPLGHLRDLPQRISKADIVIVSKSPAYLREEEAQHFIKKLGYKGDLFFTTLGYDHFEPVFPEGDLRYSHSPRLILFTGIANDKPLVKYLSLNYKIVRHFTFSDHHWFTADDIASFQRAVEEFPDAVIATTEKDAQRIATMTTVPTSVKERLFKVPIRTAFFSDEDAARFTAVLQSILLK